MKISTKGRYGLRALIDICIYSGNDIVTVKSISQRQNISERYLEQIFASLRKGGIIKAKKGAQGGYFLTREPKEVKCFLINSSISFIWSIVPVIIKLAKVCSSFSDSEKLCSTPSLISESFCNHENDKISSTDSLLTSHE